MLVKFEGSFLGWLWWWWFYLTIASTVNALSIQFTCALKNRKQKVISSLRHSHNTGIMTVPRKKWPVLHWLSLASLRELYGQEWYGVVCGVAIGSAGNCRIPSEHLIQQSPSFS